MATGAAAAVVVGGAYIQARAQRKRGQAEREKSKQEAEIKRELADETLRRVETNVTDIFREGEGVMASQLAAFAKGGVDVTTGTPLLAMEDTSKKLGMQASRLRYQAEWTATRLRKGADLEEKYGIAIEESAKRGALGTMLGGVGSGINTYRAGS